MNWIEWNKRSKRSGELDKTRYNQKKKQGEAKSYESFRCTVCWWTFFSCRVKLDDRKREEEKNKTKEKWRPPQHRNGSSSCRSKQQPTPSNDLTNKTNQRRAYIFQIFQRRRPRSTVPTTTAKECGRRCCCFVGRCVKRAALDGLPSFSTAPRRPGGSISIMYPITGFSFSVVWFVRGTPWWWVVRSLLSNPY